jgi:hypothetical protein
MDVIHRTNAQIFGFLTKNSPSLTLKHSRGNEAIDAADEGVMKESDGSPSDRGPFNKNHAIRYIVVEPVCGTNTMSAVYDKPPTHAVDHWVAVSEEDASRKMALLDLRWPEEQIGSTTLRAVLQKHPRTEEGSSLLSCLVSASTSILALFFVRIPFLLH